MSTSLDYSLSMAALHHLSLIRGNHYFSIACNIHHARSFVYKTTCRFVWTAWVNQVLNAQRAPSQIFHNHPCTNFSIWEHASHHPIMQTLNICNLNSLIILFRTCMRYSWPLYRIVPTKLGETTVNEKTCNMILHMSMHKNFIL